MRKKNKLVFGVGRNDADYEVHQYIYIVDELGKKKQKRVWVCPFYKKWKSMVERCYSEKYRERFPTYGSCSVCQEWLTFSNFKNWMETQDYEGKHLDKDILFPGNKVYSPETCVFVDQKVNKFLTERQNHRGSHAIGVCWHKASNKFIAECSDTSGKSKHLGLFSSEEEGHKAWLSFKLKVAHQLAAEQTDPRVAKALIERYESYET